MRSIVPKRRQTSCFRKRPERTRAIVGVPARWSLLLLSENRCKWFASRTTTCCSSGYAPPSGRGASWNHLLCLSPFAGAPRRGASSLRGFGSLPQFFSPHQPKRLGEKPLPMRDALLPSRTKRPSKRALYLIACHRFGRRSDDSKATLVSPMCREVTHENICYVDLAHGRRYRRNCAIKPHFVSPALRSGSGSCLTCYWRKRGDIQFVARRNRSR